MKKGKSMLQIRETHRLVAVEDIEYVSGIADRFRHSGDPEERSIGLIAAAILERLGIKVALGSGNSQGPKEIKNTSPLYTTPKTKSRGRIEERIMIRQRLIEEMIRNKNRARGFHGTPPEGAEYIASEYFRGYDKAYYRDKQGNWYFKIIDRRNEY